MLKKKYLIIFSLFLFLFSSLSSFAFFTSSDSNKMNYIQIGRVIKETEAGIDGKVFKYDKSQKTTLSPDEWFNRACFTSLGKSFYFRNIYLSIKIRKLLPYDLLALSSDYILVLHTKDIESNASVFDTSRLHLDIITDTGMDVYTYNTLNASKRGFDYYMDSKTIKETKDPKVSCAVIDLSNVLKKYNKSKKLWINVMTRQGNAVVKIRN